MAYVQPTGVIQLFKGINLDNRYMHTIYFASESAQDTWFTAKYNAGIVATPQTAFGFTAQSYSRPSRQQVKIKINAELLLGVTYMRFKNRSGMWFYAFVNYTDYVNENTSIITYEIDVMQTWFIQKGTLNPCFIEREHVSSDTFGAHLEPEPIGSDAYDTEAISCPNMDSNFGASDYIIIQTSADGLNPPSGYAQQDPIVHGIYNPTWYYRQVLNGSYSDPSSGVAELYDALYAALGNWDVGERKADIFSIIQFPGYFVSHPEVDYSITHPNTLSGYVPQNKKLYGYPYSYLLISTMDGTSAQYRWEYFDGDVTDGRNITFHLIANEMGMGAIALYPALYNKVANNFDAKVVMENFPKCAFAYDGYQAWLASGGKTKTEYASDLAEQRGAFAKEAIIANATLDIIDQSLNVGANIGKVATADNGADVASAGIGALKGAVSIGKTLENAYIQNAQNELTLDEARHKKEFTFKDARYTPNTVVGKQAPTLAKGYGKLCYKFFNVHVRKEELVRLDDFLTVYGYAINKVDTPQIHNRPYWNFVKTRGCNISGQIPASSLTAINDIFDGGIFFWNNGDNVGNFQVGGRNTYGALINKS